MIPAGLRALCHMGHGGLYPKNWGVHGVVATDASSDITVIGGPPHIS
jgi:hypothetical protein